jgi:tRNA threonylcarbamoyladenosine biosynthesis protein TsaE
VVLAAGSRLDVLQFSGWRKRRVLRLANEHQYHELAEFGGIVLVEWGDVVAATFGDHLEVRIEHEFDERDEHDDTGADTTDPDDDFGLDGTRAVHLEATGSGWAGRWDRLVSAMEPFRC